MAKSLVEKRSSYRIYINIPLKCSITNPSTKTVKDIIAIARDVSADGIYFESDDLLTINSEIDVSFQLPNSKDIINTKIKVVRVNASETNKNFGVGAEFTNLTDTDKELLRQFGEHLNINKLLDLTIKKGASDLHLLADNVPVLRVNGELEDAKEVSKFYPEELRELLYSIMSKEQIKQFEKEKELDFGIQFDVKNRFRVNVHQQRGFIEAAFRLISTRTFSFEDLNIPEVVKELARHKDGLVLIAGPTGSGKTTTISAMIDLINHERKAVIITLERPIEYVHSNINCVVKQREVGIDTNSFSVALKSTLRQDPNVIVIGELDDTETIRTALLAAEAGHLVIASFHAPDTIQGIDRLVSVFPTENRRQILFQLSNCLRGIISQLLIPRCDTVGRILATEVLMASEAARKVVRNDQLIQLPTIMQTGGAYRMQLMSDCIRKYQEEGTIDSAMAGFYSAQLSVH